MTLSPVSMFHRRTVQSLLLDKNSNCDKGDNPRTQSVWPKHEI